MSRIFINFFRFSSLFPSKVTNFLFFQITIPKLQNKFGLVYVLEDVFGKKIPDGYSSRVIEINQKIALGQINIYLIKTNDKNLIRIFVNVKANSIIVKFSKDLSENQLQRLKSINHKAKFIYLHGIDPDWLALMDDNTNTFWDVHGAQVEELILYQNQELARLTAQSIGQILKSCTNIIVMTNNMKAYVQKTYLKEDLSKPKFYLIPYLGSSQILSIEALEHKWRLPAPPYNVIFSGGAAKWHNLDVMRDSIESTPLDLNVKFFLSEHPNYSDFTVGFKNRNSKISVNCSNHIDIFKELRFSHFGLIVRDNTVINQIACPAKLIEYLAFGVVPVMTNLVGDFEKLGISYLHLEDFKKGKIPNMNELFAMAKANLEIVKNLRIRHDFESKSLIENIIKF